MNEVTLANGRWVKFRRIARPCGFRSCSFEGVSDRVAKAFDRVVSALLVLRKGVSGLWLQRSALECLGLHIQSSGQLAVW